MVRTALFQLALVMLAFWVISTIRETSLLSADGEVQSPAFELTTLEREVISLNQVTGHKTIIYFFAPWCAVCKASMGNLEQLSNEMNVKVIAIALDYSSTEEVEQFVSQLGLTMPIALGHAGIKQDYKIMGYPTYYVLDKKHKIISKSMGYSTEIGMKLRTLI
ncbi:TlpA family protein disulfide reductase [Flocculibacter collagenilyticus]|uniref:TlpA family protein disulfide reductase n=1 Tax=Flocculibacter collagenilyticus TaxID=2744479 RepID=UPI001F2D5CD8|nr:TlpA disulfide reductase family protein [Flocculibacter collagenilyticus]